VYFSESKIDVNTKGLLLNEIAPFCKYSIQVNMLYKRMVTFHCYRNVTLFVW
jgi:hypothetical protein